MEKYQPLLNLIEKAPQVEVPDNFTDQVMAGIGPYPSHHGALQGLHDLFFRPRHVETSKFFPQGITNRQCGFYFFLVSLFYIAVGLVFLKSLNLITSSGYQASWLIYQPEFSFAVAVGFALLGVSFFSNRPVSANLAKFGILVYAGSIIFNNIFLQIDVRLPIVALALLPLTIGTIIIGGLLTYAMNIYSRNNMTFQR